MMRGAGILIFNSENKVLICKRAEEDGYGKWCFVGGSIESIEMAREAIIRETKEEVGLQLLNFELIDKYKTIDNLEYTFVCNNDYIGEINIQEEEISETKWVYLSELNKYDLFTPSKISLEKYLDYINKTQKNYLYKGWLSIKEIFNNGRRYEKLEHKDAVSALVFNKDNQILLVKQFRPCIGKYIWEIPAGVTDKEGLSNEKVLIEELKEEGNINENDILDIEVLIENYMLVGCSDAKMTIYQVKLNKNIQDIIPKDDDVEEIMWIDINKLKKMIDNKIIQDNKTIMAYLLYNLNK